ncbi:MAG: tRNA (cytidine(56)-2'-O)-methyltransferase [Thermoplasmata archaeon]|nr:tRNA (cytidine(56)-2'-O)-methyltransferase [Thermoplasmata archaeon]
MITVLRLGERPERDHRINTHLSLVARAFGADKLIMFFRDPSLLESVSLVNEKFGGDFEVEVREKGEWKGVIKKWDGVIVHLTMYGVPLEEGVDRLRKMVDDQDILVILGGKKVPAEVYQRAHLNIGVGSQPHSEVAALAVFLDRYLEGKGLRREMEGWKYKVVPQERGKKVISADGVS